MVARAETLPPLIAKFMMKIRKNRNLQHFCDFSIFSGFNELYFDKFLSHENLSTVVKSIFLISRMNWGALYERGWGFESAERQQR